MARGPVREVTPAEAAQLIADGAVLLDTREPHEWNAGHLAGATLLPPIEVDRTASSRSRPTRPSRSSSTAPPARARCARRSSWRRSATPNVVVDGRRHRHLEGARPAGRAARLDACHRPQPALRPPPGHARGRARGSGASCSSRRCCSSAPVGSAHRACSISPRRASGPWASSTSTSSTCPTCSARSSTPTIGSA